MQPRQLNHSNPHEELRDLCAGFFADRSWVMSCGLVEADDIPQPARSLLVHDQHMTAVLGDHFRQEVELEVLAECLEGEQYTRQILLRLPYGAKVVEFGIARLDLRFIDEKPREAILGRKTPLGAILIENRVLTKVTPKWYLRFPAGGPATSYLGAASGEAYGRLATIHCNGDAAVELLEIVPGESRR